MNQINIPHLEKLHEHPKGVFFIMHGHFGNKNFSNFNGLAEKLFDLGYDIISIDAYKHGDRKAEPYFQNDPVLTTIEMLNVIEHTLEDIIYLYNEKYQKRNLKISIVGTSMGGHIAYLLNRFLDIEFCIPIIGSPNLKWHYENKKKTILMEQYSRIQKQVEKLTLMKEEFKPKYAFALQGEYDDVVSKEASWVLLGSIHNPSYSVKDYPCGHELTQDMISDIIEFVRSKA